ncbi:hypothetical protein E4U55_002039, partial [Claviceps digitariae]
MDATLVSRSIWDGRVGAVVVMSAVQMIENTAICSKSKEAAINWVSQLGLLGIFTAADELRASPGIS